MFRTLHSLGRKIDNGAGGSRARWTGKPENEKGHLVWSFDISRPNAKDITEILVDAKTGKIISTQTESPRDQAREAATDKKQQ